MFRSRRVLVTLFGVVAVAAASVAVPAAQGLGFNTSQAPMLTLQAGAPFGSSQDALISVGEALPNGYTFKSLPDGVSILPKGNGRVHVYVNHETSSVPFPFNSPWAGGEGNQNDFDNAEVSQLTLDHSTAGILSGALAIKGLENYQRFCSNYLATAVEGFDFPILFTNEEAQDWVYRHHTAWPGPTFITPGAAGAEQAGVVVALDARNGKRKSMYGMGRFNHENNVAIPGFHDLVVLSGDDTFSTTPASSQLYMYKANHTNDVWTDRGTLYAFVADTPDNDYFDVQPGETVFGTFVPVPRDIAKGKSPIDGHELTQASDFPSYPAPPAGTPDGPQWILDQWGNVSNTPSLTNDVFDFIRIEDVAYDKRPGMSNVVYLADSGRATAGPANPLTVSTNGRVWKLKLDPNGTGTPTRAELSIVVQGDDNPTGVTDAALSVGEIHQPDNLETTVNGGLFVQEDPSSNNQFSLPRDPNETSARIWYVPLGAVNPDASKVVLAEVDQSLDENANPALGAVDVDTASAAKLGAWESSGIVDVSKGFGHDTYLVTIQAHSYWVAKATGPDVLGFPNGQDYVYKNEAGQLILLRLPGA
jgi:hypothetical protein